MERKTKRNTFWTATYRNPYAERWAEIAQNEYRYDRGEAGALAREANEAEAMGKRTCSCGGDAFFRPGVGAWKCTECGAHYVRGEWMK